MTLLLAAALVPSAASQTFTGVVTDTMCGADHKMMNVTPDSQCVRDCVEAGAKYALLEGEGHRHARSQDQRHRVG